MPYVISVRQTGSLPPASFRFRLAADTLALGYVLGTIYLHSGLSPVRLRPCWAHTKKGWGNKISPAFIIQSWSLLKKQTDVTKYLIKRDT
jgi:hypothetical protein